MVPDEIRETPGEEEGFECSGKMLGPGEEEVAAKKRGKVVQDPWRRSYGSMGGLAKIEMSGRKGAHYEKCFEDVIETAEVQAESVCHQRSGETVWSLSRVGE